MLNIPAKDLINGLPIRWAACNWASGRCGWYFPEWREYLMQPNYQAIVFHLDILKGYFQENPEPIDPSFLNSTKGFLAYNKALTLLGFIDFWNKCCR